jgi:hypothetical protein
VADEIAHELFALAHGEDPDSTMPVADPPWWLSDAEVRRRFGGPQVPPTG